MTTCPRGHAFRFRDAYRACLRREFSAGLETFPYPGKPLPWSLLVDGDDVFFGPSPSHSAQLLLPPLPPALETKYGTLGKPGAMVIVLYLAPGLESGVVNLLGDDRAALDKLWTSIVAEGGIALRQRDGRRYWDLELSTSPQGVPGLDGRLVNQFVYDLRADGWCRRPPRASGWTCSSRRLAATTSAASRPPRRATARRWSRPAGSGARTTPA